MKLLRKIKNRIRNFNPNEASASDRKYRIPKDISDVSEIYEFISHYTMTPPERVQSLISAVDYIVANNLPGDFVESGVWRGGSSMASALALVKHGVTDKKFWLYDTFEGMVEPTLEDGVGVKTTWEELKTDNGSKWCCAPLDDVLKNMASTGYPTSMVKMIKGDVCETIPKEYPSEISLLRLDTDWYESTKTELETLFPRVVPQGIVIIDDYGRWEGCKQAVDEYFSKISKKYLLHRIDGSARILIKN